MMRAVLKTLLVIEIAACFGPITLLLLVAALLVPVQILVVFDEPSLWRSSTELVGWVLCGVVGLLTLFRLLDGLFSPAASATVTRPWRVIGGAVVGLIPLLDAVMSSSPVWRILGAMALGAGLHVLFLSRRTLFPTAPRP